MLRVHIFQQASHLLLHYVLVAGIDSCRTSTSFLLTSAITRDVSEVKDNYVEYRYADALPR